MGKVYFIKASKKELKFAAEAIDLLMSQKVNCCVAGAHAMYFNKQSVVGGIYAEYLEEVGIDKDSYFAKFVLSVLWPENDVEHAIRRLRFVVESGFIPCIRFVDLCDVRIAAYNPFDREWYDMRAEYHEGNILQILEAKIDLIKGLKYKKSRSRLLSAVAYERRFFGVGF